MQLGWVWGEAGCKVRACNARQLVGTRGIQWKHTVVNPSSLLQLILYPYSPRKSVEERPVGYQSPACGHTRAV